MSKFVIYDVSSGRIVDTCRVCPHEHLEQQLGEGMAAIEHPGGLVDASRWRVEGGDLVAVEPLLADLKRVRYAAVLSEIASLELAQGRPLRELAMQTPAQEASAKLQEIDAAIAMRRAELHAIDAALNAADLAAI